MRDHYGYRAQPVLIDTELCDVHNLPGQRLDPMNRERQITWGVPQVYVNRSDHVGSRPHLGIAETLDQVRPAAFYAS